MKAIVKKITFLIPMVRLVRKLFGITPENLTLRYNQNRRQLLIDKYFNTIKADRKLQIGCQIHAINGWLNVDLLPKSDEIAYMDATQKFPFLDNSFSFVFSEHMIEHVKFEEGLFMVKECYRVLNVGGKIRLVTPNLKFLIDLYNDNKTDVQNEYILFCKRYFKDERPLNDTTVINNFFRDWGHQFIYDAKTLDYILSTAGFKNISFLKVNESSVPEFRGLEKHGLEIGQQFNELESIIVEAEK